MIGIPNFVVKEAGRVYGDMAEKVAFDVSLDPVSILSAFGGGYAANRVYSNAVNKEQVKQQAEVEQKQRLESDHYSQVENVLNNLKIVFTPINVVYSVNGQVFDILGADEMTPYMKNAFLNKDANYFRTILVNKMNMEMQLAEQAFAKRLLAMNTQSKEAGFLDAQEHLMKLSEEVFDGLEKSASRGLSGIGDIVLPVNFDNLRPFSRSEDFFNTTKLEKVAGLFDVFKRDNSEELKLNQLKSQVKVAFMPDRVIFLHNGQLIEQLSLLHMNEEGYEAFRKKDANFFLEFFLNKSREISSEIANTANPVEETLPKEAEVEDEGQEKTADSLEDVVSNTDMDTSMRDHIDIFQDYDIHPVVYEKLLSDKYGETWSNNELEAIIKQLEVDFQLEKGIADIPLNKISAIHAVSSEEHAMFSASFTFEKFIRAMVGKDIILREFQGNLSFNEIMFGLEMAKAFNGDDVFLEFHRTINEYVSEELFQNDVRFVSQQIYDETDPEEKDFFSSVNGLLRRKWTERDTQSIQDEQEWTVRYKLVDLIVQITDEILHQYAEEINLEEIFTSTRRIIENYNMLAILPAQHKEMVRNVVVDSVVQHIGTAFYLQSKQIELTETLARIEKDGVN